MKTPARATPVIGIAGWKNSGKTTLVTRIVAELTQRGLRVATVKHAHHAFQIDTEDTDSARHRRAGAVQVAVVSRSRWALIRELQNDPEPELEEVLSRLDPCDLVIVEGYKSASIPKIEVRRRESAHEERLAERDPTVLAIAADHPVDGNERRVFHLDDIAAIAEFVMTVTGRPSS
jgi:molybdopterin-guanine dinucleotide biosynthesis protein B